MNDLIEITVNGASINEFRAECDENFAPTTTAKNLLEKYLVRLTGSGFKESGGSAQAEKAENRVIFAYKAFAHDGFMISVQSIGGEKNKAGGENVIRIEGNERGVIYGAAAFLERLGCGFFTPEVEALPENNVTLSDFFVTEESPFAFRDVLSLYTSNREWSLKNRLNSCLWGQRNFGAAEGGGYRFAGCAAHTLTGEFLLAPYTKTHPEYFALRGGKRLTDQLGQVCMTNAEAMQAAAAEINKLLDAHPECNIVSASMGDNNNFCECEKCAQKVNEKGLTETYFDFVNAVAREVKKTHKNALIHTFAYMNLSGVSEDYKLENNVMVQYCMGGCVSHGLGECEYNTSQESNLKSWLKKCKNLFVWNYSNCFKYELLNLPNIYEWRKTFEKFARLGVQGVFNEGAHDARDMGESDFVGMPELRGYLLARLMWNPYMSERVYETLIENFCRAFYGAGYRGVVSYLKLLRDCSRNRHVTYDGYDATTYKTQKENHENDALSIDPDKFSEFILRSRECIQTAQKQAETAAQKARVEKLGVEVDYYYLFRTMKKTLESGSEEEKREAIALNRSLIERMKKFHLRKTFWGRSTERQLSEIDKEIPPSEWNYRW